MNWVHLSAARAANGATRQADARTRSETGRVTSNENNAAGALVGSRAARLFVAVAVTVAPAVDHVKLDGLSLPHCPWLFVQGEADDVVSPARVRQWAVAHAPAASFVGLPGVGHFFHGALSELQAAVAAFALEQGKKKPGA